MSTSTTTGQSELLKGLVRPAENGQKIRHEGKLVKVHRVADEWVDYSVSKGRKLLALRGCSIDDWQRIVANALTHGARYDDAIK